MTKACGKPGSAIATPFKWDKQGKKKKKIFDRAYCVTFLSCNKISQYLLHDQCNIWTEPKKQAFSTHPSSPPLHPHERERERERATYQLTYYFILQKLWHSKFFHCPSVQSMKHSFDYYLDINVGEVGRSPFLNKNNGTHC